MCRQILLNTTFKHSHRGKPILFQDLQDEAKVDAFLNWLIYYQCSYEGCDSLGDVSAKGSTLYSDCVGDHLQSWKKGGYSNIINLLLVSLYFVLLVTIAHRIYCL